MVVAASLALGEPARHASGSCGEEVAAAATAVAVLCWLGASATAAVVAALLGLNYQKATISGERQVT